MIRTILLLLCAMASPATASPEAEQPRIGAVRITLADATEAEVTRLQQYLASFVGKTASATLVDDVAVRIRDLKRYQAPLCAIEPDPRQLLTLHCIVRRTAVVRSILIETAPLWQWGVNRGLPFNILEQELRKRIFLRPGELIDETDPDGRTKVARQRSRVEEFLEGMGYFGARVVIRSQPVGDRDEVDVIVTMEGGSRVRVRHVIVKRAGPLSRQDLIDRFGRLCGQFPGGDCFEKNELNEAVVRLERELVELGHPEARVRVQPTLVNPRTGVGLYGEEAQLLDAIGESCTLDRTEIAAHTELRLPLPPRCVDLAVDVDAGPNVRVRFHGEGEDVVTIKALPESVVLWLRSTLFEPLSRGLQLASDSKPSLSWDTAMLEPQLRSALTFNDSASVDDTEIELSRLAIEEKLRQRGYLSPSVRAEVRRYDDGDIAVDYWIKPGAVGVVERVSFVGNHTFTDEQLLDDVELAATKRSFQELGAVSAELLAQDVDRLRAYYEQQGFPENNITVHAQRRPNEQVEVGFVIEEGPRFVVATVAFDGGDPLLIATTLRAIAHCQQGKATLAGASPLNGEDCAGSPLRPEELPIDAQRVANVYAVAGFPNVQVTTDVGFSSTGSVVRFVVRTIIPPPPLLAAVVVDDSVAITAAEAAKRLARGDLDRISTTKDTPTDTTTEVSTTLTQLRLGEIFIEGNLHTDRSALLREAQLFDDLIGAPINPDAIATGISRLRRTGLFSRVDVELLGVDDGDDQVHVRIVVEERPSATVDLSAAFSTLNLFALRVEARNRNLFGSMLDANAAIDMGLIIGRASAVRSQLRWPRIAGTDVTVSFNPLTASYTDLPAGVLSGVPRTPYGETVTTAWNRPDDRRRTLLAGSSLALDWMALDLNPAIDNKLSVGVGLEARVDFLDPAGAPVAPASLRALQTLDGLTNLLSLPANFVATITPRIAWTDIDNPFDPRTGSAAELFFRTAPLSQAPLAILGMQGRLYWTIADRLTLAAGGRLRWGQTFGDTTELCRGIDKNCEWALMQNDLLRLGGERSVRGVPEGSVGEEGLLYDTSLAPRFDDDGVGKRAVRPGRIGAVANAEARFSLFKNILLGDIKPAAFVDVAFSGDNFDVRATNYQEVLNDSRYAVSVGLGLRYVLPIGPLAFDVAWSPTDRLSALDQRIKYYLYLGYLF
jgi:outer membrane protein assembly factor BamA